MPIPEVSKQSIGRGALDVSNRPVQLTSFDYLYCNVPSGITHRIMVASVTQPSSYVYGDGYFTPCPAARTVEVRVLPVITSSLRKTLVRLV